MNKLQAQIPILKETIEKFAAHLGLQIDLQVNDGSWYDPRIELGTSGIGIAIYSQPGITSDIISFGAYSTYWTMGSREIPPSEETEDLGPSYCRPDDAVIKALTEYVKVQLEDFNANQEQGGNA